MITLLNGETWLPDELTAQMHDADFYYNKLGITKALSTSSLSQLLNNPEDFYKDLKGRERKPSDALRMGNLVHWGYLEPEKFYQLTFVDAERTNAKEFTAAVTEHGARNVFKAKEQRIAESYVDVLNNKEALINIRKNAELEAPAIKMLLDIPIRGKADMISGDTIYDLKTTRVNPSEFNWWKVRSLNYDLQAFIYCQLFEMDYFSFIPINKMNHRVGIVHCSKDILESGEEKFYKAIEIYKRDFMGKELDEIADTLSRTIDETIITKP